MTWLPHALRRPPSQMTAAPEFPAPVIQCTYMAWPSTIDRRLSTMVHRQCTGTPSMPPSPPAPASASSASAEMLEMSSALTWHNRCSAHFPVAHDVEHRESKRGQTCRTARGGPVTGPRPCHAMPLASVASCLLHYHPSALHAANPVMAQSRAQITMALAMAVAHCTLQTSCPRRSTTRDRDVSHITLHRQCHAVPTSKPCILSSAHSAQNHRVFRHARQTPRRHALHRLPLTSCCCSENAGKHTTVALPLCPSG